MRRDALPANPISTRTPPAARPDESHRRAKSAPEAGPKTADLAFADTVVVDDLDSAVPPSGILYNDEAGAEQQVTPLVFPPPHVDAGVDVGVDVGVEVGATHEPGVRTRFRQAFRRVRDGVEEQRAEMTLLWSATAAVNERHPLQAPGLGRRLRTLLSFFEWDRADLLRAAWIGIAVFFFAATIGAVVLQVGSP